MKMEKLIKDFRAALLELADELDAVPMANLNAALDKAERLIIRKEVQSIESSGPLAPGGWIEDVPGAGV